MAEADLDVTIRQIAKAQHKSLIGAAKKRHAELMARAAKARDKHAKARLKLIAKAPCSMPRPPRSGCKLRLKTPPIATRGR